MVLRFRHALATSVLCTVAALASDASSPAVKRPMVIHKVGAVGLEIWTEANPEWDVRTDYKNGNAIFVAETPALTAPPAGMSWVSIDGLTFTANEMKEGARGAIWQAARNYGANPQLELRPASYGDLSGYEAEFSANAEGVPVDVKVFCGHQPGRPAVAMHAYTLQGKLGHIREHIRRSWTHVRYLKQ